MKGKVYLIKNLEEYGKLIAFCIEHDVSTWRTYWDEREAGNRCYHIDWKAKRCFYASRKFYECEGFEVVVPKFEINKYGVVELLN